MLVILGGGEELFGRDQRINFAANTSTLCEMLGNHENPVSEQGASKTNSSLCPDGEEEYSLSPPAQMKSFHGNHARERCNE